MTVLLLYMGLFASLMSERENLTTYETSTNSEKGDGHEAAQGPWRALSDINVLIMGAVILRQQ